MTSKNCTRYITMRAEIHFPEEHICCDLCPLMETYSRKQCRATGEYLLETRNMTGAWCPLTPIIKEEESGESEYEPI